MLAHLDQALEPFVPNEAEAAIAREALTKLRHVRISEMGLKRMKVLKVRLIENPDIVVDIPARVIVMFRAFLVAIAESKPVSIIPHETEFTTQQAADFLNVSRPYLVSLIDRGEINHRMVGTHRRIRVADLISYKAQSDTKRRKAIAEMTDHAQRLKLP